ncbi:hypothetical protein [Halobacillus sp. Cin3]|uniref:hypothetical protein n=1 Tax=Halobacillus sp. Cin3 TaxID=2928441 RepID=UPI00248EEA5F|nr:hypothetical protein [Halobacillus sp. Cin3]
MIVGRIVFVLGLFFVFFSAVAAVVMLFTGRGGSVLPWFGLLNGFMAMGVGDLVIKANQTVD